MKCEIKHTKFDPIQTWLDTVAYSNSGSPRTERNYRAAFTRFLTFIDKTADDILAEYEDSRDRDFKRKYAQYVRGWISSLSREGYTNKSIKIMVAAPQSFFKYSDLPLGHIPMAREAVIFHNRDITREEIAEILNISTPRDRAAFAVMAQSGLRPDTISKLKIKHLESDWTKGTIPCKVTIPQEIAKEKCRGYFTFIAEEAVRHLRNYLKTRSNLTRESLVFTLYGKDKPLDRRNISHLFHKAVVKLRDKGILEFTQKEIGKPSDIRLYNLRKFFRKQAHQAGFEIVQFWMGHIVNAGVEESYRPQDPEFHRKLYAEKAMPFLRIEKDTPLETDKIIAKQAEEIERLKAERADFTQELADLKTLTKKLIARVEAVEKQQS